MGTFASETNAQFKDDEILFSLTIKGEPRKFEISGDALRECFGAEDGTGSALLKAFERGSDRIRRAAEEALNAPTDGLTPLGTGDFEE
ncbi:DUF1488 family protein [Bordetella sp. LUAb4]|uniref:DUF1488 family protein n=1 Tax=Bordetella sp. LUAb4 TaxID=2843195 RepID=UPI001E40358E|nr:DUF1488 family protein [Bordetella sp. LUAb4]